MNVSEIAQTMALRLAPLRRETQAVPGLYEMFERCFMNTLRTTVQADGEDVFVITGDIPAMWLRDSSAQMAHYVRFADDPEVARLIRGLIARQMKCVLRDPYANAFNRSASGAKAFDDFPPQIPEVWERKYEVDSLCYPLYLAEKYFAATGDRAIFTPEFAGALRTIARLFLREQDHSQSEYRFMRKNCPPSDTLCRDGRGAEVARTGMVWSGFRPSDDACAYGYLIPANLMAVGALKKLADFAGALSDDGLRADALRLAAEIQAGVECYGAIDDPRFGRMYAYEVDGMGRNLCMDDANVPSLLSLPYLGVCDAADPVYQNTRRFVLSSENPFYYKGAFARGVGSPHTPEGYIWPISLCVQAITSTDDAEIEELLGMLLRTDANTGSMHESFDPNDPGHYTRAWFAWANSMFAEMLYRLHERGKLEAIAERVHARYPEIDKRGGKADFGAPCPKAAATRPLYSI